MQHKAVSRQTHYIRNAGQSQPASQPAPIQAEVSPHIALLAMTIDAMQIPHIHIHIHIHIQTDEIRS